MVINFSNYEISTIKHTQNLFQETNTCTLKLNLSFFDLAIIFRCLTKESEIFNRDFFFNYYFFNSDNYKNNNYLTTLLHENIEYQTNLANNLWKLDFTEKLNFLFTSYFKKKIAIDSTNKSNWFPQHWLTNKGCCIKAGVKINSLWGAGTPYQEHYYLQLYDNNNNSYEIKSINEHQLSNSDIELITQIFNTERK